MHQSWTSRGNARCARLRDGIGRLLAEAASARADWVTRGRGDDDDAGQDRRGRACAMLDALLAAPPRAAACRAAYLTRVASRIHLVSRNILQMETSFVDVPLSGGHARALAVMLADLIRFADDGATKFRSIDVQIVVDRDAHRVIAGMAVRGDFTPIASFAASRALMRARSIAEAVGGGFERGADAERMVFGIVLPPSGRRSSARAQGERL